MFVSGVMIINLSDIYKTMFLICYINVLFASYRILDFDLFALPNIVYVDFYSYLYKVMYRLYNISHSSKNTKSFARKSNVYSTGYWIVDVVLVCTFVPYLLENYRV